MKETLEAFLGLVIVFIIFGTFFSLILIGVGAKISGIKNLTFRRLLITSVTSSLWTYAAAAVFSALPLFTAVSGFIAGLILSLFLFKTLLRAPLKPTLLPWGFNALAQVLAVFLSAILFTGGIGDLLSIL